MIVKEFWSVKRSGWVVIVGDAFLYSNGISRGRLRRTMRGMPFAAEAGVEECTPRPLQRRVDLLEARSIVLLAKESDRGGEVCGEKYPWLTHLSVKGRL